MYLYFFGRYSDTDRGRFNHLSVRIGDTTQPSTSSKLLTDSDNALCGSLERPDSDLEALLPRNGVVDCSEWMRGRFLTVQKVTGDENWSLLEVYVQEKSEVAEGSFLEGACQTRPRQEPQGPRRIHSII